MTETSPSSRSEGHDDRRTAHRDDSSLTRHADQAHAFARANRTHDAETGDHVLRIGVMVERVAVRLGSAPADAKSLSYDAMLHDVGKLRVHPALIRKSETLTKRDRVLLERHTIEGERLLHKQPGLERAARIARSHHEAFDGSGYPDGLAGEAIPLEARITAVADVFDALVSERPYKDAWPAERALDEIRRLAGTKLDPRVVEALAACFASGELDAVLGR